MSGEAGLFGYLNRVNELAQRPTALEKLNESIDWSSFEPVLRERLNFKERPKEGRKAAGQCLDVQGVGLVKILQSQRRRS